MPTHSLVSPPTGALFQALQNRFFHIAIRATWRAPMGRIDERAMTRAAWCVHMTSLQMS